MLSSLFFFFFQAEDGIRDVAVTGVQTCALPICFLQCQISRSAVQRDRQCRHPVTCSSAGSFSCHWKPPSWIRTKCRRGGHPSVFAFRAVRRTTAQAAGHTHLSSLPARSGEYSARNRSSHFCATAGVVTRIFSIVATDNPHNLKN